MTGSAFRLGIIGAGNVVETYHLPVLRHLPHLDVAWVCDSDHERARALASLFDIRRSFRSIDRCPDVDAVLVAIPVGARRQALPAIMARGWHAFCEKPFALDSADHKWILDEARAHQVRLGIGLVRRHYHSTRVAARVLASQLLGPVSEVIGGEGSRVRRTGRGDDWYQADAKSGGGVLLETGSHLIDQAFTVCGVRRFEIARCRQKRWDDLELETKVSGALELEDGSHAAFGFVVSRVNDVYNGLLFRCERGEVRLGLGPSSSVTILRNGGEVVSIEDERKSERALYAAIRSEWQEFVSYCKEEPPSRELDTGVLLTSFVETCHSLGEGSVVGAASRAP